MNAALSLENGLLANNTADVALSTGFGFLAPQGASVSKLESDCCGCNNPPPTENQ